ncbi:MAG: hypothetical protein Q8K78_07400 [Planctomycetaceae bacterium]|nr:hypothetical protein [Planctomycetaceae bacterium]
MTITRNSLITRSLLFAWRTNLAIVLGVAVSAAVIGGALIVGDSVRASLRQMTLDRLGNVDGIVTGPRFFRQELAAKSDAAPAIVMVAGVQRKTDTITRRAGQVNVYGIEAAGWAMLLGQREQLPQGPAVVINQSLADALNAAVGQEITIWIELPSAVPRDTLLGKRDNDSQEVTVTVGNILPDGPGAARFGLNPTQQLPMNAFVALDTLQDALNLAEIKPTRRDPVGAVARINSLLMGDKEATQQPQAIAEQRTERIKSQSMLADLNLRIVYDTSLNVLVVESEQMILETRFADAAKAAAEKLGVPSSPVMVYLANWVRHPTDPNAYSMYSTVAGLDVLALQTPFGPFEFVGGEPAQLAEGEVIINEFLAEDLKAKVGDSIRYGYHIVGSQGELPEEERSTVVRGIVRMTGPAVDKNLTPHVKGVTDVDSLSDWDQPFPMKLDEVTPRDDEYWDSYRATPKMFFRLQDAQAMWRSRYGSLTSVRIAIPEGQTFESTRDEVAKFILDHINPADVGLAVQPVKAIGLQAANGATDFTGLFIGFSFFLILAAMILVGLLFRLAIEQRVRQLGLLGAIGWSPQQIRQHMLSEGAVLVAIGSVLGGMAAVLYAQGMIYGLTTWWIGAIGTKFLRVDVQPLAVMSGVLAAAVTSFGSIAWGLRQLRTISLRERLVGVTEVDVTRATTSKAGRRAAISGGFAAMLILASGLGLMPAQEAFSGFSWAVVSFFVAGMLLLASGLWAFSAWLQIGKQSGVRGHGLAGIVWLGGRNAARRKQRSVLTTGLIASATFVVAAVAAGHKNPAREAPDKASGNGGFTLVAESSSPILYDLNTAEGRSKVNLEARTPEQAAALAAMKVFPFRVKPGEDASCLNLFQTRAPTILGVPEAMIERGGFKFVGGGSEMWKKLHGGSLFTAGTSADDKEVPVLGDMNTLMFNLKKGVGSKLAYPAEDATFQSWLTVQGMFDGAVFQGVLLMSEENFLKLFPERKGFQYFLVEVPPEHATAAAEMLETELAEYGFDTEPVAERLARFLAVQNTYLSTFQSLGGLGLLLGTFGLATVMLRNVLERQPELALLRAVGYRSGQIAGLILSETALLLCWGLITGTVAALLSMGPHLVSTGADVPWISGAGLLIAIAVTGLLSAAYAVRTALAVPIVSTLRGE